MMMTPGNKNQPFLSELLHAGLGLTENAEL